MRCPIPGTGQDPSGRNSQCPVEHPAVDDLGAEPRAAGHFQRVEGSAGLGDLAC
jgi:hypothetical protein